MTRLVNIRPGRKAATGLAAIPMILIVIGYMIASAVRHAANPADKLLPTFGAMGRAFQHMASESDPLTGKILLWADTLASLERLGIALVIATGMTMLLGLSLGMIPLLRAKFGPLVATLSVIPPVAILPILFIVFGLGEASKIMLIVIGITPVMVRDVASHVAALPQEQMIKAQTLGAGSWLLTLRVALPQMMPRLIDSLRLALGPAWVFLISAEAIAADVGLGYRIFLVRRYLSMDIILPYVAWISLLAILFDLILKHISLKAFPWAHGSSH
jgi:NitT/TauT family transport system permease protein